MIDPRVDRRWQLFVAGHARSSVFHETGWFQALHHTYGFEPFVITTANHGEPLRNGVVACRVASWITGKRLISLPFSDHCEPLVDSEGELQEFLGWLRADCTESGAKYLELRPLTTHEFGIDPGDGAPWYYLHTIDLTPCVSAIFASLHEDSMQRRIRRAQRELTCEVGRSDSLLEEFYRLLVLTRRRHGVPPQPRGWFRNLMRCMGDQLEIRVARKENVAVASMMTLRHKSTVVYKYGGSDANYHYLGGMPFLFWDLIETSRVCGATEIDLGRSDPDNHGLITFKDRLGSKRRLIRYYRHPHASHNRVKSILRRAHWERVFSIVPTKIMPTIGSIFYRHLG